RLEGYDVILPKQKYLAGNISTRTCRFMSCRFADQFHLPFGHTFGQMKWRVTEWARWGRDISSCESWLAVKGGI
ncbi:hypothetical protein DFH29DRAFT_772776, partial [Suillus ampliporus]